MASSRIKGITVEIGGDTTKLTNSLKSVDRELASTQRNLRDVNKLLKMDPTNTELLAQKQKLLTTAVGDTKERLTALKTAAEQANAALEKGEISQDQYDALQREIVETTQKLKDLETELKNTDSAWSASMKQMGGKLKTVGGKITDTGSTLTTHLTAPITALGAASIAAFSEVDSGMDIIEQKTGATGKALSSMEKIAKDMATEIPTDFETAGAAVGEVNTRFGVTGKELQKLSTKFVKFAALNNTDVSSSVDTVQKALTAFGLDSKNAGAMLDTFNKVGQNTGISVDTLATSMVSNAAAFKQMGLSASDAANFLGQCETSGTDTSAVMAGLTKALKQATANGKPLDQALADIQSSMVNAKTDTEGLSIAYEMFGSRAGGKIYEACKSGSLSFASLGTSLKDNLGNVDETYAATLDGTDALVTGMNSLKEAGAALGSALGSVLGPIIQSVSSKLKQFVDWFSNLSPRMQELIVKIGLIVAAVGPVLVVIGKIVSTVGTVMTIIPKVTSAISAVKTALSALNVTMLANPIALIVTAIAGLVAAFIYLWNNCDGFRQFWIDLWEKVKQVAISVWEGLKTFFFTAWEAISSVAKTIWGGIKTFFSGFWNGIKTIVSTVVGAIKTIITTYFNVYKTIITTVLNAVKTVITTVWNGIKTVIVTVVGAIKTFLSTAWNAIKTIITTVVNAIKTVITTVWNGIKTAITTVVNAIKTVISTVWNGIKRTIATVVNSIKTTVTTVFGNILNGIKNTMGKIVSAIKEGFQKAITFITSLPAKALQWGRDMIMGIVNGIKSCIGKVGDAVKGVADKIKSYLHFSVPDEGPLTDYETWMPDFMKGLANGIEKSKSMVAKAVRGVAQDMVIQPSVTGVGMEAASGNYENDSSVQLLSQVRDMIENANSESGDIVIPIYLGNSLIDEMIIDAKRRVNMRSGGMVNV